MTIKNRGEKMKNLKVMALQMNVVDNIEENIKYIKKELENLSEDIDLIVLPEMFICPYDNESFVKYREEEGGHTWNILSELAKEHGIYIVAGSVAEEAADKIYNTSYVFDKYGRQIAKHRKIHLFDIDIEGGQSFKESDTFDSGDEITVFDTEFGKIGLCICYDIRFPELFRLMVDRGAKLIIVPAAFNMTTGPKHWELLFRARAVDNQVYTLGVCASRNSSATYVAWGHSILVSPFGDIIEELGHEEGLFVGELDMKLLEKVRNELPLLKHRRSDLYTLKANKR